MKTPGGLVAILRSLCHANSVMRSLNLGPLVGNTFRPSSKRSQEALSVTWPDVGCCCCHVLACTFLVGIVLGLSACDPMFGFYGTVRNSKGVPITNATVDIDCDAVVQNRTATDSNGTFKGSGVGWRSDDCSVVVVRPGYREAFYTVGKSCVERPSRPRNACLVVRVDATLVEVDSPDLSDP